MTLMVGAVVAFGSIGTIGTTQSGAVGTSNTPVHAEYYLALGGSGSLGVQPTIDHPNGQPTHAGYANDLLTLERSRWSGLQLVQLGCPGETTGSFLAGGDHCRPVGQSQLTQAVSFLQRHANVALVTIDLGFNNVLPCLVYKQVNEACVLQNLATVRQQLTQILSTLHAADPSLRIVGVGHYDPYLYAQRRSVAAQSFASASIAVIDSLNETLGMVYSAAGVPMANVGTAFALANAVPTTRRKQNHCCRRIWYASVLSRGHAPLRLWATHIPTRTATRSSLKQSPMSCGHDYRGVVSTTVDPTQGLSSQGLQATGGSGARCEGIANDVGCSGRNAYRVARGG